ncbi:hypothetical protein V511_04425 [Mesotoga sp. Brook.08.YT.4.2.5.1]|nr:hypothetical protein V511_04425 [Mesotoga sp. Brook.08.YT.4.2.5.1]PVD15810.1 hypothetical protein V512_002510 [Mesotoga sp. Brook.08.105.5.1]RDI93837.1 hypothetical protein Q502_02835 [Mesotoga sp. Brook.08.YT.4.2.5.2.]
MFSVQVTLGFVGSVKIPHYSQTKVIEPSRERPVEIKVDPETPIKNFLSHVQRKNSQTWRHLYKKAYDTFNLSLFRS